MDITFDDARKALLAARVADVIEHPAAVEFRLSDGRTLSMFDGDHDYPRAWDLEEAECSP